MRRRYASLLHVGAEFDQEVAMKIENTTFGAITIDGTTYQHDVVVRLSGEVVKRKKKLSKKHYGTSHVLSKDEAKFVFERGCEQLILGSGQVVAAGKRRAKGSSWNITAVSVLGIEIASTSP